MNRTCLIIPAVCCLLFAPYTVAAKGGEKGPADQAYEHASDNASFKRGEDYRDEHGKRESEAQEHKRDRRHEHGEDAADADRNDREDRESGHNRERTEQDTASGTRSRDRDNDREQRHKPGRTGTGDDKPDRIQDGER